MIEIGLMPSHTGEPGGKQTGQSMTHYIIDGGSYDTHWQRLEASGYTLDYQDREEMRRREPKKVKVRYACSVCAIHAWGKPGLALLCVECSELMK